MQLCLTSAEFSHIARYCISSVTQHLVPPILSFHSGWLPCSADFSNWTKIAKKNWSWWGAHLSDQFYCDHHQMCPLAGLQSGSKYKSKWARCKRTWDSSWELGGSPIFILYVDHLHHHHRWANWGTWDSNGELGGFPIFILYLNHLHHQWANWGAWEN